MIELSQQKAMLRECSIPAALEIVGERWSFLILRAAFNGLCHFEEFQSTLGIARNILSSRLARLVEHGVLDRNCDVIDRRKVEYRLTAKGHALLPTVVAIRQWGEQWVRKGESRLVLVDARDRLPIAPLEIRAADGRVLGTGELEWLDRGDLGKDALGPSRDATIRKAFNSPSAQPRETT